METVTIDVVSDVVCPWCYLGKKRLEQAVEAVSGEVNVAVTFRPYQLNPDMPPQGVDHKKHLADKLGGELHAEIHRAISGSTRQMYMALLGHMAMTLGFIYFLTTQLR